MSEEKIKKNKTPKVESLTTQEQTAPDEILVSEESHNTVTLDQDWRGMAQELANIVNTVLPYIPQNLINSRLAQTKPVEQCRTSFIARELLNKYVKMYDESVKSN